MNNFETPYYPVNSFPQKLSAVIWEQFYNNEGPLPLIGCSLIGALSGAISDKVDVERFPGTSMPTAIFTWVVASSGSRKSSIDRMIVKIFGVFELESRKLMKRDLAVQRAAAIKWKADYDRLDKRLRTELNKEEQEQLQLELEELLLNEPPPMLVPKALYRDATPEGIAKGLYHWPAAFLNSSEAGPLLRGRTMSNQGFFSSLWDGEDLIIDRASQDSFVVVDPRLTISLMVQEKTFANFLDGPGRLAEDNGFLARFLLCYPDTLEGTRFNQFSTGSWRHLECFHARLYEILITGLPKKGVRLPRIVLQLSTEAHIALKNFSNRVEADLGLGRFLSDVKGSASKSAENVVRLAALFHSYEGFEGQVSAQTLQRAVDIVSWHLLEFKRLFGVRPEVPLEFQDAIALEKTIGNYAAVRPGQNFIPKTYLYTHSPPAIRNKARLNLALQVLSGQGKITVQRANKTYLVFLNSVHFPSVNQRAHLPFYSSQLPALGRNWN